jgi:hypothetical protein
MAPKSSGAFASIAGDDPLDEATEAARVLAAPHKLGAWLNAVAPGAWHAVAENNEIVGRLPFVRKRRFCSADTARPTRRFDGQVSARLPSMLPTYK